MRRAGQSHDRYATAARLPAKRTSTALANSILLSIPDAEYRLLQSHLEPFEFRQHAILHEPAHKLGFVYFPNCGLASLLVATEDGETVEAGMVGSEGVLGVAAAVGLSISPFRQFVQMPGDGLRITVGAFQSRLKSAPQLQMALTRYAVVLGMQMAQTAACNRLHEIGRRLARWLLMAAERIDSNSLPITHDFLASILGTDRPSVSLAAKVLRRKGVIQYRRGAIQIVSRKKLEGSACECYRVIQRFSSVLRSM